MYNFNGLPHKTYCASFRQKVKQKVNWYSTSSDVKKDNKDINPNFVTGLVYAEASFSISIHQKSKLKKDNWVVQAAFQIRMHSKDSDLLALVQQFF